MKLNNLQRFIWAIKFWYKRRFNFAPVYRIDLLMYIRLHSYKRWNDLKWAIRSTLEYFRLYYLSYLTTTEILPEFGQNMEKWRDNPDSDSKFWWEYGDWEEGHGRMAYLDYLIAFYKNDETNLNKLCKEAYERFENTKKP